jgi:hypothetical protein
MAYLPVLLIVVASSRRMYETSAVASSPSVSAVDVWWMMICGFASSRRLSKLEMTLESNPPCDMSRQ